MRKFFVATLAIAALVAFAGTCTITHISLTTIGSNDVFAGEVHNDSGVNILQHNVIVAFLNSSNSVLETKTVQPCLRTLPTGGVNYFSAKSSFSSATTTTGLARVNFDSTFKVGTAETGSGTITGLTVNRGTTTLVVAGTFKNTDSSTLEAPNACAVVYNSSGNVVLVGLDQTMSDLAANASDTFSITLTVPDSTTTVDHVNVYIDGLKDGVPTLPVATDTGNAVNLTPTATVTPNATPGAAAKLGFTVQPVASSASPAYAIAFTTSPQVAVQDAGGLTVTSSTASVTLGISAITNPQGATISCTNAGNLTVTAVNGVASWTGCSINKPGAGYQLVATSGSVPAGGTSASFNVNAGAPTTMILTGDPSTDSTTYNTAFHVQPQIKLLDAGLFVVWNNNSTTISLTLTAGTGSLSCTGGNSKLVSSGVATFAGCLINALGSKTITINSTSPALTALTTTFTVGQASQTITFGALANKTLAQSPVTINATASSGLAVTFTSATLAVCTVSGTSVTLVSAGTCTIHADQAGDANYLAAPQVDQSFTVS